MHRFGAGFSLEAGRARGKRILGEEAEGET
jgi:hypothetical protein